MGTKKYQNKIQRKKAMIQRVSNYNKKATKMITIRFMLNRDEAVIEKITSQKNKTDYLRQLILKDIENNGK